MATGIPTRRKVHHEEQSALELSYKGKQSKETIISRECAELASIWSKGTTAKNRLYWGENSRVMASLLRDNAICGQVKLAYIDPPFSTQSVFQTRKSEHAYQDILSGAGFIEFLRERVILLRELLSEDGSLYLHLDSKMIFAMKMILDEIFGPESFRNCIVRKKCNPKNYTRNAYGNIADYILFYTKSPAYVWNRPYEAWDEERTREYQYIEESTGRRYMKVPVHAPGIRNGETGMAWRGKLPPAGKHWQYPPRVLDEMDARGEIYWSANGNPRRKVYLDESEGVPVQDIWLDFKDAHNQNIHITGYPTEKNPNLLRRIIAASSNPGDLVMDCFSGSGTTLAVADGLGRNWIGIDESGKAIETTLRRFAVGTELMGDFVGARNPARPKHPPARRIEDFSFIAECEHNNAAEMMMKDWKTLGDTDTNKEAVSTSDTELDSDGTSRSVEFQVLDGDPKPKKKTAPNATEKFSTDRVARDGS